MGDIEAVCVGWVKRVVDPTRKLVQRSGCNVRVYPGPDADDIYSYGQHFSMAKVLRNRDGSPRLVVLNGDQFSVSTSNHQTNLRRALDKHAADVPKLIVPFSALQSAQIDVSTIRPLDVRSDRVEYVRQSAPVMPESASLLEWTETMDVVAEVACECSTHSERMAAEGSGWKHSWGNVHGHRQTHQKWAPTGMVHGRSVQFGAEWIHGETYPKGEQPEIWHLNGQLVTRRDDGEYEWHTTRHWLGDAVFSAKARRRNSKGERVWSRRKFVSSFDRQESRPLYFLCELPRTAATTLEDAIESLKPEQVRMAEMTGRTVTRQGDMFAVPMPGMTKRDLMKHGAVFSTSAKSVSLIGTAHTATMVATLPDGTQLARGTMYHDPSLIGERWRGADHARRRMGDGKAWHLIAKNTVPVQK